MPDEICPNGSARNADVPDFIVIDNEHMTALLPPDWQWLGQFLPFIAPIALDTNVLCSIDPPEYPDVGAIQWAALASQAFTGGAIEAGRLVAQILTNLLWYRCCHCLVDTTPPIPVAPAPPANLPVLNPPVVVPPEQPVPCAIAGYAPHELVNGNGTFNRAGVSFAETIAPRWARFSVTNQTTVGPGWTLSTTPRWGSGAGQVLLPTILTAPNTVEVRTYPVPSDPAIWTLEATTNAVTGTGTVIETLSAEIFCGNDLPGVDPTCCPPDPLVTTRLDQILNMVTLLQRQGEPFAYVPGPAVHAGLVGVGDLDVEGLIGVLVEVTTLPPELGHIAGMPDMLFDVGWLTVGTADGWERRIRIDSAEQLVMPAHMGLVTRVGYSLSPNVVIMIRELVREP